jgi:hypothetical protein
MIRIVIIFGSVLGAILITNGLIMVHLMMNNPDLETNDVIGYAAMVVVFSLVYFGVRNYRNKRLDGFISFGKAFKAGALIALVAATVYVGIWLFYYYLFVPDFLDHYINYVLKHTPETKLAAKTTEMAEYKELYKNPLFVVLITYSEVLPIGLVVALVSALILKRKRKPEKSIIAYPGKV